MKRHRHALKRCGADRICAASNTESTAMSAWPDSVPAESLAETPDRPEATSHEQR